METVIPWMYNRGGKTILLLIFFYKIFIYISVSFMLLIHKWSKVRAWFTICTAQKNKFSVKDFFSKCDQIHSFLQIWSHLLNKCFMENSIFVKCWLDVKEFAVSKLQWIQSGLQFPVFSFILGFSFSSTCVKFIATFSAFI